MIGPQDLSIRCNNINARSKRAGVDMILEKAVTISLYRQMAAYFLPTFHKTGLEAVWLNADHESESVDFKGA